VHRFLLVVNAGFTEQLGLIPSASRKRCITPATFQRRLMSTIICGDCGSIIPDTSEYNVFHGMKYQPCDEGYGLCFPCCQSIDDMIERLAVKATEKIEPCECMQDQ
jgi:hypothetical protein